MPLQNLGSTCLGLSRRISVALLLILALDPIVRAQEAAKAGNKTPIREDALRAAFIYRLASFVSWPQDAFASAATPISICLIAGNSTELERVLKLAAGKMQAQRNFELRILQSKQSRATCHVVYEQQTQVDQGTSDSPYTLVIVDSLEKLKRSGHLALVMEKKQDQARLVFYAERKRISASTFKLSAELLPLLRFI